MSCDLYVGDALGVLKNLPSESVNSAVTSPPYFGVKVYNGGAEIGVEKTYPEYIAALVQVFREVRRVLKDDGVLWLVIGDSYFNYRSGGGMPPQTVHQGKVHSRPTKTMGCNRRAIKQPGLREKTLIGVPWRLALALVEDGWVLRADVCWSKTNPTPEKVKDRPTKSHEYVFLLAKNSRYYYNPLVEPAVLGGVRNMRTVWEIPAETRKGHNAIFPQELARRCVLTSCPEGGTVLDPFGGSGTTGEAALRMKRNFVGIDISEKYVGMMAERLAKYNPVVK